VLDDENRTTSRALTKAETDLATVEAQLATDRQEYAFIQQSLQSIKIGMNRLSLKILGEESVDMSTPQGCSDTLSKVRDFDSTITFYCL
jgi:translation elongation factor EF-1beta